MTPNQLLKATRRERDLTQDDMADALGISTARINQFEKGESIPLDRIRDWCSNPRLPDWARHMAEQMWYATLEQQHQSIGDQIAALGELLQRDLIVETGQRPPLRPTLDTIPGLRKGVSA